MKLIFLYNLQLQNVFKIHFPALLGFDTHPVVYNEGEHDFFRRAPAVHLSDVHLDLDLCCICLKAVICHVLLL
jgi:hypothetical protein